MILNHFSPLSQKADNKTNWKKGIQEIYLPPCTSYLYKTRKPHCLTFRWTVHTMASRTSKSITKTNLFSYFFCKISTFQANLRKDAGVPAPLPSSYHCFESRMISLFSRLELDFAIPTGGSIVNRPAEATLSWERGWG